MQYQWEYFGYVNGTLVRELTWEPGSYGLARGLSDLSRFWVIGFTPGFWMGAKQAPFWDGTFPEAKPAVTIIAAQPPKLILDRYTLTDARGGTASSSDRDWLVKYDQTWVGWGESESGQCGSAYGGQLMGRGLPIDSPSIIPVPNVMDSPNIDDEIAPRPGTEKDWSAISLAIRVKLGVVGTWTTEDLNGNWCGTTPKFDVGEAEMSLEYIDGSPVLDKNGAAVRTDDPSREFTAQLGYIVEGEAWLPMQLRITTVDVHSIRVNVIAVAYVQGKPAEGVIPPDPLPTPIPQHQYPVGSSATVGLGRGSAVPH